MLAVLEQHLKSLDPDQPMIDFSKIYDLDLSNFKIRLKSSKASAFGILKNLKKLKIFIEKIHTDDIFDQLHDLEDLHLSFYNRYPYTDRLLVKLVNLKRLHLENQIVGSSDLTAQVLTEEFFSMQFNLEELYYNEIPISIIRRNAFKSLNKLRKLTVYNNRRVLKSFPYVTYDFCTVSNRVGTLETLFITNFVNINEISITFCDIENADLKCLEILKYLERLDLSNNRIKVIDDLTTTSMPSLKYLNLSKNIIIKIDYSLLKCFNKLEILDLSFNELNELNFQVLNNQMDDLKEIILSNNRLPNLDKLDFKSMIYVKKLDLSFNRIKNINFIKGNLKYLEYLDLKSNEIRKLDPLLHSKLGNLVYLNVSENFLKHVNRKMFLELTRLEILDLSSNLLKSLPSSVFSGSVNLKNLNLENNCLKKISKRAFSNLENIEYLNLFLNSKMKFSKRMDSSFCGLKLLDTLCIDFKAFKEISNKILNCIRNVRVFFLIKKELL